MSFERFSDEFFEVAVHYFIEHFLQELIEIRSSSDEIMKQTQQNFKNKKTETTYHRWFVYITNKILWSMLHLNHQPHPESQHFTPRLKEFLCFYCGTESSE